MIRVKREHHAPGAEITTPMLEDSTIHETATNIETETATDRFMKLKSGVFGTNVDAPSSVRSRQYRRSHTAPVVRSDHVSKSEIFVHNSFVPTNIDRVIQSYDGFPTAANTPTTQDPPAATTPTTQGSPAASTPTTQDSPAATTPTTQGSSASSTPTTEPAIVNASLPYARVHQLSPQLSGSSAYPPTPVPFASLYHIDSTMPQAPESSNQVEYRPITKVHKSSTELLGYADKLSLILDTRRSAAKKLRRSQLK